MASFATISVRMNADLKDFSSKMQNAQRQVQKVGKQMQSVGKNLTIGVTAPIVALGYKSVEAWDKQAKAIAQVEAGLKSTGNAAGYTSGQLQKMASDLQNNSLFGDEEILQGATAQLLTFTNIAGEQFSRTQQAALDLATRLDGDLKSASIQLGKALNDPVANLSALSRSGIQFSKEQKATINSLVETNRLADAQTIILDELQNQYGGAAEAAAKAGTGPMKQFSNIMGDIMEQFGEIITEYLNPFIAKLKDLALRFQNLDKSTKKTIVVVASLAAALGPVLLALGTLLTILPAIGTAFAALTGPIGLVVAAIAGIAYVVYNNWDKIKKYLVDTANYFIDLYNESIVFRTAVESVIVTFKALWNTVKLVFNAIWSIIKNAGNFIVDTFKNVGAAVKAVLTGDMEALPGIFAKQGALAAKSFSDTFKDIGDDVKGFTDQLKTDMDTAVKAVATGERVKIKADVVVDNVVTGSGGVPTSNNGLEGAMAGSGRAMAQTLGNLNSELKPIQEGPFDIIASKMPEQIQMMTDAQMQALDNAVSFNEGFSQIMESTAESFVESFGTMIGSAADGGLSLSGVFNMVLTTIADLAIKVGKMAIGIGISVEGIKKALQSLAGPVAIAAGVALVALGTAAKSALSNAVPFADGGIVSGPTLGLVGEYAGARNNPEVIAPLDKLRGLLSDVSGGGESGGTLQSKVSGQDLLLVLNRAQGYKNRRG